MRVLRAHGAQNPKQLTITGDSSDRQGGEALQTPRTLRPAASGGSYLEAALVLITDLASFESFLSVSLSSV